MTEDGGRGETIRRLQKPLDFAGRLEPARLATVLPDLAGSLAQILEAHSAHDPAFDRFRERLAGLEAETGEERLAAVRALAAELGRIEPAGPEPAARPADEVQWVKGVGPRMAERLGRLGIKTVEDLLYHLPARYEDRRDLKRIRALIPGERATVRAEIMALGPVVAKNRQRQYHLLLSDGSGLLVAIWFRYSPDYLEGRFHKGQKVVVSGQVGSYSGALQMAHPEIAALDDDDDDFVPAVVPIYPLTEGVTQNYLRRVIGSGLEAFLGRLAEPLPEELLDRRGLPDLPSSLRWVHQPPTDAAIDDYNAHRSAGHRRLAYEEFFFLELGLALRRQGVAEEPAPGLAPAGVLLERFRSSLPFAFTPGQDRALAEIAADLARPHPMHRLLQGDVGSGKTVVAVAAALLAIEAGYQAALMAPTEVLAEQHYRVIAPLLAPLGLQTAILTGALRGAERQRTLAGLARGEIALAVGTHALIEDKAPFSALGLGVIDEQHRFGVLQRARLKAKGPKGLSPHLLVMTATPIPRTLAMTVYGDLRVSLIKESPPGRAPIRTRVLRESERGQAYELVRAEVKAGGQAFVVYPLVEESESLELRDATTMSKYFAETVFPDLRVGLVHGQLGSAEKDAVMRAFQAGEIDALVATTVIEVGIDNPNAAVMVIEHADRFGLSQLHQLRGRVGRGSRPSHCLLISGGARTEDAYRRLKAMERTGDGFKIAEEDLAIRGPGEFFGTRQSGLPDFRVANLIRDAEELEQARDDAFALVAADPLLSGPGHVRLGELVRGRWGRRLALSRVG